MFVPAGKVLMTEWTPDFTAVLHNGLDDTITYFKPDVEWNLEMKTFSLDCM